MLGNVVCFFLSSVDFLKKLTFFNNSFGITKLSAKVTISAVGRVK